MSITNVQVITKALGELGLIPEGEAATAAQAADALTVLNQMMAEWAVMSMDLHFPPQDTLSAVCPIPTWAEQGVITNLAVRCASPFRAPISQELALAAFNGNNAIATTLINQQARKASLAHLPKDNRYASGSILTDGD